MANLTEVYITVRVYTEEEIANPQDWAWDAIENLIAKNFNPAIRIADEKYGLGRHAQLVLAQRMVAGKPVVVFKKEK